MPSDDIAELLKDDFDDLTSRLERDGFERRLLYRLGARQRARMGVVGLAGGLGAAFAASQFANLGGLLAPYLTDATPGLLTGDATAQIAGAMLLAMGAIMTALVLRKEA